MSPQRRSKIIDGSAMSMSYPLSPIITARAKHSGVLYGLSLVHLFGIDLERAKKNKKIKKRKKER